MKLFILLIIAIVLITWFLYPYIDAKIQLYLIRNPSQPRIITLDKNMDDIDKEEIPAPNFIKRIMVHYMERIYYWFMNS